MFERPLCIRELWYSLVEKYLFKRRVNQNMQW